jgi:hypothetical protein
MTVSYTLSFNEVLAMSRGSQILRLRVPPVLFERLKQTIESNNQRKVGSPWTLSDWIRDAIWEKLAHQSRGKMKKHGRGPCPECKGKGCEVAEGSKSTGNRFRECWLCQGSGKVTDGEFKVCHT